MPRWSDAAARRRYPCRDRSLQELKIMTEVRGRTFTGETVDVDDTDFVDCTFESATLRYSGGEHPQFENCTVIEAGWYFTGPALRTIQLLQQINNTGGEGGSAFVADLFRPGNLIGE
jgi:hypothetical protein